MGLYMDMDIAILAVCKVSVTWYCAWKCFVEYPKLNKEAFRLQKSPIYGGLICIGLVLCGIGDIFLELVPWYPNAFFLIGMLAFFIGHVCFICAFTVDVMPMKDAYKAALVDSGTNPYFIGCYAYAVLICYIIIDGVPSSLVIPIIIYAFTIASMTYTSLKRVGMPNSSIFSQKSAALGALIFALSDSILAVNKFRAKILGGKYMIMITYYSALICITMSCYGGGRGVLIRKNSKGNSKKQS